jgi:predicted PhzF superfamily epimerase YddE/YHI9
VELQPEAFGNISPIFDTMTAMPNYSRGIIVCCVDETRDFLCRFFAPKAGIPEDPVTGSAFCVLAPYFASKLEKKKLIGFQQSQRGGLVECHVEEDVVALTGATVVAVSGTLWI